MNPEIKILIQNSQALSKKQKKLYLKLVEMIPESEVEKLSSILEQEVKEIAAIKEKGEARKAAICKKTIMEAGEFFKKSEKNAIAEEESSEKQEGENILNQLDNL